MFELRATALRTAHPTAYSRRLGVLGLGFILCACTDAEPTLGSAAASTERDDALDRDVLDRDAGDARDANADPNPDLPGRPLRVVLDPDRETFVDLGIPASFDGERDSTEWDLMFTGWDIFTNSGPSGPGVGAAFGPSDPLELLFDTVPEVPLRADRSEGPLANWYAYDAGTVSSRQHIYGIRDGERLWKFQVLSYYGVVGETEVSAMYRVRYARVEPGAPGEVIELGEVDGTAGGFQGAVDARAGCLDLDSGEVRLLGAAELAEDRRWHLCFRRTQILLNSGLAGSRGVLGVDLDANEGDALEYAKQPAAAARTRFEAVDHAQLDAAGLSYRADDAIGSAFSGIWVADPGAAAVPSTGSWIVRGSDGERHYGLLFTEIEHGAEGLAETGPRAITLRVKPLRL